ncbi:Deoxyribonuclease TATDN1 [Fasciola gigantica]|uniref:Deoxyribonuclease TATDN1 n=1 Tax=Fasciola gigantica TaxID=46835 RepID=A0A504YQH6_FASGI|nr:Deoxyribonuclease TATDN1 [Fasciola gigantica]
MGFSYFTVLRHIVEYICDLNCLFYRLTFCHNPYMTNSRRFIDIGANLTDKVFRGLYRDRSRHPDDFDAVLTRAWCVGMDKIIVTAGSYSDACDAIDLCRTRERLYTTVGCHPTRCSEMNADPSHYAQQLKALILNNKEKVVAVGECGLDYDREHFCPRDVQRKQFDVQLQLASRVNLPLFLHCRAAYSDFIDALKRAQKEFFLDQPMCGVVHTFDGSWSHAKDLLQMGLFLGVNGCSLKTENQLSTASTEP